MQTSKILYWGAQLGGWFVYAMLTILATYADNPAKMNSQFWISLLLMIASGLAVTHLMRLFLLKRNWLRLKFGPLVPRIVAISIICASIFVSMIHITAWIVERENFFSNSVFNLEVLIDILSTTLLMILWNAIYFTYHFFKKSIDQELHNLQLQSSQNEIELKTLRSQLNPHFLFNSLNSIRALIDLEPVKAKQSVTTLSNLLRSSLVLGKNEFITLAEELQIVKSYLELEKIRFEERLEVYWEIDALLNEILVPPFILQTQAENAIKHGISKIVEGGKIVISTKQLDENWIELIVLNSGELGFQVDTGIGIENSKRRLDLQYNGNALFELFQNEEHVICSIKMKI
jgi:two-component system LytT family sensor kinase